MSVTGLDASPEMLEIAAARIAPRTNVCFSRTDLFAWTSDRRYDFVFFGFCPRSRFSPRI
jgi:trans-aconitate methyltransferase